MLYDVLMKHSISILTLSFIAAILLGVYGCSEKYPIEPLNVLQRTPYKIGDTSYIEITPPLTGFQGPTAIMVGKDNILYVADTKNNKVKMLDIGGRLLYERSVLHPTALSQDYKLDLLVGCSVQQPNGDIVAAILRIHLYSAQHDLSLAQIDTVWRETTQPRRRFVGISVMPDNTYLVARTGSENGSPIDPDTRIMRFSALDRYVTPVTDVVSGTGNGINFINQLTNITTTSNSRNFIVLQSSSGVAYGVIRMDYQDKADFQGWVPAYDPADPKNASVDLIRPFQFQYPVGVAIDNKRSDLFITDAVLDSVFKFDSRGKFKKESFGGWKTEGNLKHPQGATFYDKTLYVADDSAACIFRYKLSIDF
jgi:hypothetical protein